MATRKLWVNKNQDEFWSLYDSLPNLMENHLRQNGISAIVRVWKDKDAQTRANIIGFRIIDEKKYAWFRLKEVK